MARLSIPALALQWVAEQQLVLLPVAAIADRNLRARPESLLAR